MRVSHHYPTISHIPTCISTDRLQTQKKIATNTRNNHYQSTIIVNFDWEIVQTIAENSEMSITDPQDSENVEESKVELEEQKPDEMQLHMALQVQILDEVMKLRTDMALCIQKLSDLGKRMEKIEQTQGTSQNDECNPQILGLPIETTGAYQALESDENRLEQLRNFLVRVGGFTLRGTVKDFVRMTFSDAFVAMNLTWCLGTSKMHFRDSQISKTFFAACRRIQRLKQPSRALYEEAAKVALKNATQRHYIEVTGRNNSVFSEKKKEQLVMEGSPSE